MPRKIAWKELFIRIILPALLVFCLFLFSVYHIIIPLFEKNIIDGKNEMIGELLNSAWLILAVFIIIGTILFFIVKQSLNIPKRKQGAEKLVGKTLNKSEERFNNLTDIIGLGVFRNTLGRKGKIIEANEALLEQLGFNTKEELFNVNIFNLFFDGEERKNFLRELEEKNFVKNAIVHITRGDGSSSIISISAILVKDEAESTIYCDGIIDDVTKTVKLYEEREDLISELQSSLHLLNHPIINFSEDIVSCSINESLYTAAELMTNKKCSAILVKSDSGEYIGIITDRDLRERAVAGNYNIHKSVSGVMTSKLISINSNALIFEALLMMHSNSVHHLVIKDNQGKNLGIISSEDLMQIQRGSSSFLIREIEKSVSTEEIILHHKRLPGMVKTLVDSGAGTKNITKIISSVSDSILRRLLELAIADLGEPPRPFSFIAFGSEGREEQTLITDQDNAIIYDREDDQENEDVRNYFLKLGEIVCKELDRTGISYCEGNNMASNPEWVQSLKTWKEKFSGWIFNSTPDDLLRLGIFFDFKSAFGEDRLVEELRNHVLQVAENKAAFFQHLTINCLQHKPPVGLLGKIVVSSSGDHPETFDIKKGMMPLIEAARIYSLRHSVAETNTLLRFHSLFEKNIFNRVTHREMVQTYNFLMYIRLKHQVSAVMDNLAPDNFVNPRLLTKLEQNTLKNSFAQITSIQKKLSFDFTGEAV